LAAGDADGYKLLALGRLARSLIAPHTNRKHSRIDSASPQLEQPGLLKVSSEQTQDNITPGRKISEQVMHARQRPAHARVCEASLKVPLVALSERRVHHRLVGGPVPRQQV
jgi:hypothetical protein